MKKTIKERFVDAVAEADRRMVRAIATGAKGYADELLGPEMVTRGLLIVDNEELAEVMGQVETLKAARDEVGVQLVAAQKWITREFLEGTKEAARARAIRAVVAAQWGVAINLMWAFSSGYSCRICGANGVDENPGRHHISCATALMGLLPSAEKIVDGGGA